MRRRGRIIPFPTARRREDVRDDGLAEVHRCDQTEAMVVKGLFESEGIPTLLRSRIAHSVHPFTVGAQGEVRILVPEAEAARAAILLARVAPDPPRPDYGSG
jgi:hypothetical protein